MLVEPAHIQSSPLFLPRHSSVAPMMPLILALCSRNRRGVRRITCNAVQKRLDSFPPPVLPARNTRVRKNIFLTCDTLACPTTQP